MPVKGRVAPVSVPSLYSSGHAGSGLDRERYWQLRVGERVVAVAREFAAGRLVSPLFGKWIVTDVARECGSLPRGLRWTYYSRAKALAADILSYVGRNCRGSLPREFVRSVNECGDEDMGKGKTVAAKGDTKKKAAAKGATPRRESVSRYLYEEVFPRKTVGTDEEIIAELRELDCCSTKMREDDSSARAQLAWHKQRYQKGNCPGQDTEKVYVINQPYTSEKKKGRAEAEAPAKKATKKAAPAKADAPAAKTKIKRRRAAEAEAA